MAGTTSEDWFVWAYNLSLMGMTIVATLIYLIYFIGHFAHPEDTAFGKSVLARTMIFLGYFFGYALMLTVQIDVFFFNQGYNIAIVYYVIELAQLLYVFAVGPLLLVYYESNPNLPFVSLNM
jgi:hypothetical protein